MKKITLVLERGEPIPPARRSAGLSQPGSQKNSENNAFAVLPAKALSCSFSRLCLEGGAATIHN